MPIESRNHLLLATEPGWPLFTAALEEFLSAFLPTPATTLLHELTARERDVLELLAQGQANREIASVSWYYRDRFRNHVSIILSKLGIHRRSKAIVLAREAGFGRRVTSKIK